MRQFIKTLAIAAVATFISAHSFGYERIVNVSLASAEQHLLDRDEVILEARMTEVALLEKNRDRLCVALIQKEECLAEFTASIAVWKGLVSASQEAIAARKHADELLNTARQSEENDQSINDLRKKFSWQAD